MNNILLKKLKYKISKKLTPRGIIGLIALLMLFISVGFTLGLFFYTSYRLTGTTYPTAELFDGKATVRFVDVGQGDCTLITWQGDSVLVDAGTGSSGKKAAEYVKTFAPEVDCMIITHPHEDHMGGAADILSSVKVEKLILADISVEDRFYSEALRIAEKHGTEIVRLSEACAFSVGALEVEILDTFGFAYSDLNDASLITRVTAGETEILLTGDAESGEENHVLGTDYAALDCDILKVGHHGSRSSTTDEFLAAVSPEICVISVGRGNTYGHPTDEVLVRIEKYGAEIHRTDREGHVVLRGETPSGRSLGDTWRELWGDSSSETVQ